MDGTIELQNIDTDVYTDVLVVIDFDSSNPIGMAGDYVASISEVWSLDRDGETLREVADTEQLMRLAAPEDTRFGVPRAAHEDPPAFHSPLTLAWDPVPGASSYRVALWRGGPATLPDPQTTDVAQTTWTVDLPVTAPGESYWLKIEAYGSRGRVGILQVHGIDTRPGPYRFRIVAPDATADQPRPAVHPVVRDIFGGSARLTLVPMLDGEPWALSPHAWATVGLFGAGIVKNVDVRPTNGIAEIGDLSPGTYATNVVIHDERDETRRPRAVCKTRSADLRTRVTLTDGTTTRQEVSLRCEMRMRRPQDSGQRPPEPPEFSSPLTFEWAPVPRAVRYAYEVQRFDGRTETVARGETERTSWTTALEPSLLPIEYYRFIVSADGRGEEVGRLNQVYDFRVAGGKPEPGVGRLVLVPTFDGAPLAPPREAPMTVDLARADRREHRTITARLANGAIELAGVETGIYGVSLTLDEKYPDVGRQDSDFLSSAPTRSLALLRNDDTVRREIPMYAAVELTAPQAVVPGRGARGLPLLHSPVHIAWKPVRGATRYRVILERPGPGEQPESRVSESTIPSWTAELPPTEADSYYFIIIEAHGAHAQVGAALVRFGVAGR